MFFYEEVNQSQLNNRWSFELMLQNLTLNEVGWVAPAGLSEDISNVRCFCFYVFNLDWILLVLWNPIKLLWNVVPINNSSLYRFVEKVRIEIVELA